MNTKLRKLQTGPTISKVDVIAPGLNDDASLGFEPSSFWYDEVSLTLYVCTDATIGAAVWDVISGGGGGVGVTTNGVDTKNTADASVVQLIPHGLGSTPGKIRITFIAPSGTTSPQGMAVLSYDGTTASVVGFQFVNGLCRDMASTDITLFGTVTGNETEFQTGVIIVDATNIIITWTKTNSPTGIWNMMWEAYATGGSSSEKKIGVGDTTDINWFNFQLPFGLDAGQDIWSYNLAGEKNTYIAPSGVQSGVRMGPGSSLINTTSLSATLSFDDGLQIIYQGIVNVDNTTGGVDTSDAGIGFVDDNSAGALSGLTGSNNTSVAFVRDTLGQWYTRTGDGAAFTQNTITLNGKHTLRIEYDPGNVTPQARFYVDGVLIDTITTTVPSAVTAQMYFGIENANGTPINGVGIPAFAIEV